jgi:transcription elongation factor Elf1
VPIFAMTGMDEIIYKTPDALFSGEATSKVIESCCPSIKNASKIPSIDIDALMIAIRIATFGNTMTVTQTCKNCGTENDFEIELQTLIDYYNNLKFTNTIQINDNLSIKIRPLQYDEMSYFSIENFKLQKTLFQINELADDQKQKQIDSIYEKLSDLQLQLFLTVIESVHTPDGVVQDKNFIEEWLRNAERDSYNNIKTKIEANKAEWAIPNRPVKCANCGTESAIQVVLDQSNFFA